MMIYALPPSLNSTLQLGLPSNQHFSDFFYHNSPPQLGKIQKSPTPPAKVEGGTNYVYMKSLREKYVVT